MASFIDTHCHLDGQYFKDNLDDVVGRAKGAGVSGFIVIGVGATLEPAREAIAIANRYADSIAAAVGVHPHDASTLNDDAVAELGLLAREKAVVAVGEIGLDYHYDHSPRDVQQASFRRLIALAREVKKPIVVHTREAKADTLECLRSEGASDVGGVIHCFSEDLEFARGALDLGFDISFSGIVTFKSATSIHEVAAWAPLDRIHVETDSPYLAPVPMRGKRCEPAFVMFTAQRVADLRKMPLAELSLATHRNAARRFGTLFSEAPIAGG